MVVVLVVLFVKIKDLLIFCILLFTLWACGYITFKQLLLIYSLLVAGILLSIVNPIVSYFYSIPSDWIGSRPAMTLFKKISDEKLAKLGELEEPELQGAIASCISAVDIIAEYASKNPGLIKNNPALGEMCESINRVRDRAEVKSEQKRREAESYWEWVNNQRDRKGLSRGVPPQDEYSCPNGYSIRATENLDPSQEDKRGIYYFPGERLLVKVAWCFEDREDAEVEGFRRPKNRPPNYQPSTPHRK